MPTLAPEVTGDGAGERLPRQYWRGGTLEYRNGVYPDEVDAIPTPAKKKRKTRLLKKNERKAILDMLGDLAYESSNIATAITNVVSTEAHLRLFKDRADFWSSLSADSTMMTTLVDGLIALFVRVYRSCQVQCRQG